MMYSDEASEVRHHEGFRVFVDPLRMGYGNYFESILCELVEKNIPKDIFDLEYEILGVTESGQEIGIIGSGSFDWEEEDRDPIHKEYILIPLLRDFMMSYPVTLNHIRGFSFLWVVELDEDA